MSSCIYGGRIDNEFDQKLLNAFLSRFFQRECLADKFTLVDFDVDKIELNECKSIKDYMKWINELDSIQKPAWLGLPNKAERLLLKNLGMNTLFILKMVLYSKTTIHMKINNLS
jgi:dynein heavy chain 1, cytosolic